MLRFRACSSCLTAHVTDNVTDLASLTCDEESADQKQIHPQELRVCQVCTNLENKNHICAFVL